MRMVVEMTEALRYKFRMLGNPADEVSNVFCDNEALHKNTILP